METIKLKLHYFISSISICIGSGLRKYELNVFIAHASWHYKSAPEQHRRRKSNNLAKLLLQSPHLIEVFQLNATLLAMNQAAAAVMGTTTTTT